MLRATAISTLLLLTHCSDDATLESAQFAELCGVAAPVRLLELAPGTALRFSLRIGDRLYHTVGTPTGDPMNSAYTFLENRAVWSTGPCGEAPIRLPVDGDIFTLSRWPDLPLTCEFGEPGIYNLDPEGVQPPHLVFAAPCNFLEAAGADGLLTLDEIDDDTSILQLTPFPDDPLHQTSEPTVLIDAVSSYRVHIGRSGRIHALTPDRTLVRVDLPDRTVVPVQTDVDGFAISPDERYLEWIDLAGVINLHDQSTDITVTLGTGTSIPYNALDWADRGFLVAGYLDQPRIYALPDLRIIDLPRYFSVLATGPIGERWPIQSLIPGDWLRAVDLADGSTRPLFARLGTLLGNDGDSVRVLDIPDLNFVGGSYRDEGPVWRVPLDGSTAHKIADRATIVRGPCDPHALITAVDIDADRRATLVRVDLDAGSEQRIDDHVLITTDSILTTQDPTLLTYAVDDGERSGIWRARLPPSP